MGKTYKKEPKTIREILRKNQRKQERLLIKKLILEKKYDTLKTKESLYETCI